MPPPNCGAALARRPRSAWLAECSRLISRSVGGLPLVGPLSVCDAAAIPCRLSVETGWSTQDDEGSRVGAGLRDGTCAFPTVAVNITGDGEKAIVVAYSITMV